MALTKVTGGLISTTSNYEVGVITATKFVGPIEGGVTGITTGSDNQAVPLVVGHACETGGLHISFKSEPLG